MMAWIALIVLGYLAVAVLVVYVTAKRGWYERPHCTYPQYCPDCKSKPAVIRQSNPRLEFAVNFCLSPLFYVAGKLIPLPLRFTSQ
jgi:hypothetical protein